MDPLDLVLKNVAKTGKRAPVYEEELKKAAELMGWKRSWHPRGEGGAGHVKRGLGLAFHTWGGGGHNSRCDVVIYPDGLVEARLGSQDLGTGTRTVIGIVLAETLGLPVEDVKVSIGDSHYPASGASGGSTTVGGVSSSTRRAAVNALGALFEEVAPYLGVPADQLEVGGGRVRVEDHPDQSLSWKEATAKLGDPPRRGERSPTRPHPAHRQRRRRGADGRRLGRRRDRDRQGEDVVAVQDCGLIIDLKTAESQVYGAVIMGIAYALAEEKIFDPTTGLLLNPNMEFYKLAGHRRHRRDRRAHDDRARLRRARSDRAGRAARHLAGGGDLERRRERDRGARASPAADPGPDPRRA